MYPYRLPFSAITATRWIAESTWSSMAVKKRKIGVLGFAFKAGTDDLRESPVVEVIQRLIGKGYDLRLYDKNVSIASLLGASRDYVSKPIFRRNSYPLVATNLALQGNSAW